MLKVFVIYLHLKLNFFKNINTLANRAKELMFEVTNSRNEIQLTIFATNWFSNDLRQTDHCLDENSSQQKGKYSIRKARLQNTLLLTDMLLNKNGVYCVVPRS